MGKTDGKAHNKVYFIKIHAVWCGACASFKEDWEKLKSSNKENGKIVFEEIEETEFNGKTHSLFKNESVGKLLEKVEVSYYPTLIKVENGKVEYFEGDRTKDNLAKWIGHGMVGGTKQQLGGNKHMKNRRGTMKYGGGGKGKKTLTKYTKKCSKKHRVTCKKWSMMA